MKKRKLLTDIFTIVLMVSIVLVLLSYLNVFPGEGCDVKYSFSYVMLVFVAIPLALISVALIDLVFPIIDNRALFAKNIFKIKVGAKIVLFVAAVVFGMMFFIGDFFNSINDFIGVGIFFVLYIAQFLINLDPKPVKEDLSEEDRYAQYDIEDGDADIDADADYDADYDAEANEDDE